MGYFYEDASNNHIIGNQDNNYIDDGYLPSLNHTTSEYQLSLGSESKYIKEAAIAFERQSDSSDAKGITLGENPAIYVDPGNSLGEAEDIIVGENPATYIDWVGETDTDDYYRFSLAQSSNFELTLLTTGTGLASNADVELLDSTGTQLMLSSNASQIDESIKAQLLAGTYYIRVYPDREYNTDYNLTVSATPINDAGNTLNDAKEITLRENPVISYNDWVGATDKHDYYRFSLAESNNFELTLTGLARNADVELLDSTGTQLMRSSNSGRTDESIKAQLLAGTYYIRVYPDSAYNTDYNLTVFATPVNDAGNTLNDAKEITLRENPVTYVDWVGATDTDDYYRFSLTESSNFELNLSKLTANADVDLFDSAGTLLMRSILHGPTDESIKAQLLAGAYYIRVYPDSWYSTDYTLSVSTPANLLENPPAPSYNSAPWNFIFATDRLIYEPGERVSLKSGFVYDVPGWEDVERIDWWISKDGGKYRDIEDTVEFWPGDGDEDDFGRNNTAYFALPEWSQDLDEGEYTLRGQAVDKSGLFSNEWSWNFTVQETNYAPTDLSIFTEGVYSLATDETFSVKGKVYDENGADDLEKLKVYIEKQGDATWTPLGDYFDVFSPNNGDPNWANFEIPLVGIGTGSYQVSVFAYDKSGARSGIAQSNFTVQYIHDERFNFEYGYGLVNAAAAVALANGENSPYADGPPVGITSWGTNMVKASAAWARGFKGQGVTVAVIDTGIDIEHHELKDSIWTNPGEIPDDGIDNDGNGKVDDIHGWNFGMGQDNNNVTPGLGNPGHGTHVAGIIAANYTGLTDLVAGVAPDVNIMSLRMGDVRGNTFENPGYLHEAIRYAVDNGADVINMSLSWTDSQELRDALAYAASKNVITVSAAGNFRIWESFQPDPVTPASYATDYGMSVGALNSSYQRASYSHGAGFDSRMLHVMAPGGDRDQMVFSTIPGNNYGLSAGTSMAAPHVAGVVALMLSANPNLTHDQVRQILIDSATPLPFSNQNSNSFGAGTNFAREDNSTSLMIDAIALDNIHSDINDVTDDNHQTKSIRIAGFSSTLLSSDNNLDRENEQIFIRGDFSLTDQSLDFTVQTLHQKQSGKRENEEELLLVFNEDSMQTNLELSNANELEDVPSVQDPLAPGRVDLDLLGKDNLLNGSLTYDI